MGDGLADLLERAAGITELLANDGGRTFTPEVSGPDRHMCGPDPIMRLGHPASARRRRCYPFVGTMEWRVAKYRARSHSFFVLSAELYVVFGASPSTDLGKRRAEFKMNASSEQT